MKVYMEDVLSEEKWSKRYLVDDYNAQKLLENMI